MVGLEKLSKCVSDGETIISNEIDEDYDTEPSILDQSKIECKKDLLFAYNKLTKNQKITERKCKNYKY